MTVISVVTILICGQYYGLCGHDCGLCGHNHGLRVHDRGLCGHDCGLWSWLWTVVTIAISLVMIVVSVVMIVTSVGAIVDFVVKIFFPHDFWPNIWIPRESCFPTICCNVYFVANLSFLWGKRKLFLLWTERATFVFTHGAKSYHLEGILLD